MDSFYSSPPYTYLPSANATVDHTQMYRSNHAYDRPSFLDDHHHSNHNHHQHDAAVPDPYSNWSNHSHHSIQTPPLYSNGYSSAPMMGSPRPKVTTNLWEDENTLCFQVDAKGVCVARRQDNDMINGTKLLNVVGMSRGKRDGILKNEKGRVVVKVGAMHLKGVWIPFNRARELASKFKIMDVLFPLFADEPSIYMCTAQNHSSNEGVSSKCNTTSPPPLSGLHHRVSEDYSSSVGVPTTPSAHWDRPYNSSNMVHHHFQPQQQQMFYRPSHSDLSASPVPRSTNHSEEPANNDMYLLHNNINHSNNSTNPHDYYYPRPSLNRGSFSSTVSSHHSYNLYPSSSSSLPYENLDTNNHVYRLSQQEKHYSPYTKPSYPTTKTTDNSAGSTTPSSWLSPETPTAVLFQQKEEKNNSKKRKSSFSIEPTNIKRTSMVSPTSPTQKSS